VSRGRNTAEAGIKNSKDVQLSEAVRRKIEQKLHAFQLNRLKSTVPN
jgi:hypothetical protein